MSEEILAEWTATDAEGDGGLPYVPPLAQFGAEVTTVPGLLAGLALVEGLAAAEIRDGVARLPLTAESGDTTSVPLAQFDNPYQADTVGLLAGIVVRTDAAAPFVEDGVVVLPVAQCMSAVDAVTGLIAGAQCDATRTGMEIEDGVIYYPDWVDRETVTALEERITELEAKVCECSCDITLADIEAAISEQLSAISWQLETTGLLEENDHGSLTVSTTGSGDVDAGEAETETSY